MTTMRRSRTLLTAAAVAAMTVAFTAACGDTGTGGQVENRAGTEPTIARSPSSQPTAQPPADPDEDQMKIQITIGDQRFDATLADSAAADDLIAHLPVTVNMTDHGGVEKTGRLPSPLSLTSQPEGADPDIGDVGYYAPGNDLVLYYGDQSYFAGIVILGKLDGDAARRIASIAGSVTATVAAG